jgi:hypothetical protein
MLCGIIFIGCDDEGDAVGPTETKLHYYTESFEIDGFDFDPQYTVMYDYDNLGQLENYTFYSYDQSSHDLKKERTFMFTYLDGRVKQIEAFLVNSSEPYVTYSYSYLPDSRVANIKEINAGAGISSQADFHYLADDMVKVAYLYSNGNSFEYEFRYANQNILTDKTTRGAQLCSDGSYSYDTYKSPFQTLGYVDYMLFNMSANNRLTENVNYVSCSFPTLLPESYEYEYDGNGFPTVATTKYKSGGAIRLSRKNFFYKQVTVAGL